MCQVAQKLYNDFANAGLFFNVYQFNFKILVMFLLVMYLSCAHSSNAMMVMWLNPHCANAALTANVP